MGKKICLIVLFFCTIFLYGCKSENSFRYDFDNFFGYYYTDESFETNKDKLNGLGYKLLGSDIVAMYSQKGPDNEDIFRESIIIAKNTSDKDLASFAKENLENVDIGGVKFSKGKNLTIDCLDNKLDLLYFQGRYSLNQYNIYLVQGFTKVDNIIYIISFATLDEKNRNDFASAFKDIQCK